MISNTELKQKYRKGEVFGIQGAAELLAGAADSKTITSINQHLQNCSEKTGCPSIAISFGVPEIK